MDMGERRGAEEDAALDLMVRLIKDYEEQISSAARPDSSGNVDVTDIKKFVASGSASGFKSRGYVSDFINAKRAISKVPVRRLAEFFKVPAGLFV